MYVEMEDVTNNLTKANTYCNADINKGSEHNGCARCTHTHTRTHARTHARPHARTHARPHTLQTDRGEGRCCLAELILRRECLEFAFEGRESSRVSDVLAEIVPDVGAEV